MVWFCWRDLLSLAENIKKSSLTQSELLVLSWAVTARWVCLVSLVMSPSSSFEVEVCWESIFRLGIDICLWYFFWSVFCFWWDFFKLFCKSDDSEAWVLERVLVSKSLLSLSLSLSAQPLLPNKVSEKQQHHNCITTHGFTADLFLLLAIVSRFYFKAQTWARDANLCPMIVQAATNLL